VRTLARSNFREWRLVFFSNSAIRPDRGLIDAAAALEHMTGKPVLTALGQANRYHRRVFLAPPWPEIYETGPERRHGLDAALAEYSRLVEIYPSLGYEVLILPKVGVSERAEFILNTLEA